MTQKEFIKGVDLSFVDEVETEGGTYYEHGQPADVIDILHRSGVNAVRLRLWHTPTGGYCNLERTIQMVKRVKEYDMDFLLDFHYSDYWADPGKQTKPKAWQTLNFVELIEAVYHYTKDVIEAFKKENIMPDMVQIGNEITNGMLWEDGKIYQETDDKKVESWDGIIPLIKAGLDGVKAATTNEDSVKTMIHIDRGGDNPGTRKFFDQMEKYKLEYDVIGLSYYPWWHGHMKYLKQILWILQLDIRKKLLSLKLHTHGSYQMTFQSLTMRQTFVNISCRVISQCGRSKGIFRKINGHSEASSKSVRQRYLLLGTMLDSLKTGMVSWSRK